MNTWIIIYSILFIIVFVILPRRRRAMMIAKKRRELFVMTNELVKSYIGKRCYISCGTLGTALKGTIINVQDNWIEIETKSGTQLFNSDFVTNIKVLS